MEAVDWASLNDQELLERRISKLGLRLEGTTLEPLIKQLYDELSAKGLVFHPPCHIGDEWFVPVGIPAIFVPFFLVNDRLRALERTMMLEVEGGTQRVVHETDPARGGARLQLRLSPSAQQKVGSRFLGKLPTMKRRIPIGPAHSAAVMW